MTIYVPIDTFAYIAVAIIFVFAMLHLRLLIAFKAKEKLISSKWFGPLYGIISVLLPIAAVYMLLYIFWR